MLLFDYTPLSSIYFIFSLKPFFELFSLRARLKHIGADLLKQCHASILITFAARRINPLSPQFTAHSQKQSLSVSAVPTALTNPPNHFSVKKQKNRYRSSCMSELLWHRNIWFSQQYFNYTFVFNSMSNLARRNILY